jgi:TldD protein
VKAFALAVTAVGAALVVSAQAPKPGPVLEAMRAELQRSLQLKVPNLEAPYFIQYLVDEEDAFDVSADLGGVVSRNRNRFREANVRVRVGDYAFDNTNFPGGGFGGGSRYDLGQFPIEDSLPAMRRYFWLATDTAYKAAVEAIARKRAALKNVTASQQINDFAHAEPVHHLTDFTKLKIDEDVWTDRVRALSAIFAQYPDVRSSMVEIHSDEGGFYLANSEGTEVQEPEHVTFLQARATSQASDGMTLRDAITFHAADPAHLPPEDEMRSAIATMAQNLVALARSSKGEDYNGPVLFEGVAGAQIMAEVLASNLSLTRRPAVQGGRGGAVQPGDLEGRLGARVLPEWMDVTDDPTPKQWQGRPLFGSYEVDREGVLARPLRLVEKGVLKGYLLTRQPMRGQEGSNGHARLPGNLGASAAAISNLFVTASETTPVSELKKKLIELCQARGLPYGVIVRKMDFPSSATVQEAQRLIAGSQGGSGHPVSLPISTYKVFPDGREELIRGIRFRGFNARSLKDILAAGDDSVTFEFMESQAPFALIAAGGFTTEATVVAPSILIDDLELHPVEEELPKLPVVPPPALIR